MFRTAVGLTVITSLAAMLALATPWTESVTSAPASQPASASAPSAGTLPPATGPAAFGPYIDMVNILDLTAEQEVQIKDLARRQQQAQADFLKTHQDAWAQAMLQAASNDPAQSKEGKAKVQELQRQYDALSAEHQAKVMAVLTKPQALAWEEKTLRDTVLARILRARITHGPGGMTAETTPLTEAQLNAIEKSCSQAAKEIQTLPNPYDPAKRVESIDKLVAKVSAELDKLTPATAPDAK